jgi:osmotically-inducible protein OsmY
MGIAESQFTPLGGVPELLRVRVRALVPSLAGKTMKSDLQLKSDVTSELMGDPSVNAATIGVGVKEGIVTLTGSVDTFMQKHAVEHAARRVAGVRGIALDLEVQLEPRHRRTDAEIVQAALDALRWHALVPDDVIQIEVDNGWVTLMGELDWAYQSLSAEQAVRPLIGVRGITNLVRLKQSASAHEIQSEIASALARHAEREAHRISVQVTGSEVTLQGKVGSLAEHDAAIGTATAARGVTRVIDRLELAG